MTWEEKLACWNIQYRMKQKACAKIWRVKEPFEFVQSYEKIDIKVPNQLGRLIPDWMAVHDAAIVAHRSKENDKDKLFISLYNEIIENGIFPFRMKYKTQRDTATDKMLNIEGIPEEVKRFVLRISDIMIERETDNANKDAFDFIRVRISIPSNESHPDRKEFIRHNLKWISVIVMNGLKDLKKFTRFGIPVTCLALKSAIITHTSELELLYELKYHDK